ncbi:hypothetical protein RRG08_033869 [Elysia crispata]|uniref:Uncharacterized protein n=1 Tax=Elysia crispata TaxID=231223 RepID=A0AAE1B8J3_9GAST|nr:hypothetical protein RRG08_033869 [Elysia crispata]
MTIQHYSTDGPLSPSHDSYPAPACSLRTLLSPEFPSESSIRRHRRINQDMKQQHNSTQTVADSRCPVFRMLNSRKPF